MEQAREGPEPVWAAHVDGQLGLKERPAGLVEPTPDLRSSIREKEGFALAVRIAAPVHFRRQVAAIKAGSDIVAIGRTSVALGGVAGRGATQLRVSTAIVQAQKRAVHILVK